MPQTYEGAQKTKATNLAKYGPDFYKKIGRKGGQVSRGGGFTGDPERAREAGRIGGKAKGKKRENNNTSNS